MTKRMCDAKILFLKAVEQSCRWLTMGSITCMGSQDFQSCQKVESIHTFVGINIAPDIVENAAISTSDGGRRQSWQHCGLGTPRSLGE